MGATLLQGLFNVVDTFWVGRGLGPAALAGVSTAGFTVWMMLSMAELSAVGLTAVASRRHGERKPREAAIAAYHAYWLAVGLSVALGLLGLLMLTPLFRLMATPPDVTVQGASYLAVYLAPVRRSGHKNQRCGVKHDLDADQNHDNLAPQ